MFRLGSVLIRQTRRSVHMSASGRHFIVPPPVSMRALEACHIAGGASSTRALAACHLAGRASRHQGNNPRFMSSLEITEGEDDNPFGLIAEDMKNVYKTIMNLLDVNITNKEMHDISAKYYRDLGENNCGVGTTLALLVAKATNYHMFNDGTMTNVQIKLLAVVELMLSVVLARDDMIDNSPMRRGMPSAHTLWNPYKVVLAGNLVLSICLGKAAELSPEVNVSICQMLKATQKTQLMCLQEVSDDDMLSQALLTHGFEAGAVFKYWCIALARAVHASDSLVDIVSGFGDNLLISVSLLDDIWDSEEDIQSGNATVPVTFAVREHPELKEMILRRFRDEGDVKKACELVKNSKAFEETKILVKRHYTYAIGYLSQLADSPYKTALETLAQMYLLKLDASTEETIHLQV